MTTQTTTVICENHRLPTITFPKLYEFKSRWIIAEDKKRTDSYIEKVDGSSDEEWVITLGPSLGGGTIVLEDAIAFKFNGEVRDMARAAYLTSKYCTEDDQVCMECHKIYNKNTRTCNSADAKFCSELCCEINYYKHQLAQAQSEVADYEAKLLALRVQSLAVTDEESNA